MRNFKEDGVVYLELRTIPRACKDLSKDQYVATVLDCINAFNSEDSVMTTKLILGIDRKNTAQEAMALVDLAIMNHENGVVGVDLCGNPTKGDISIFGPAFLKAKRGSLGVTLHFAEVPVSSTEEELRTLLSYAPDRLGHAINVPEDLKEIILKRKLGLELCLTCNVNAKLIEGGIGQHHFGWWRQKDCAIVLCVRVLP